MSQVLRLTRVAALGLPAIYQWPTTAEEGGLIGYGLRLERIWESIFARQLVKLLRGAKAADMPIEQPTTFGRLASRYRPRCWPAPMR